MLQQVIENTQDREVVIDDFYNLLAAPELQPVLLDAQEKVRVPEGLNLDTWIGEPFQTQSSPKLASPPQLSEQISPVQRQARSIKNSRFVKALGNEANGT
jgi:hypothetical protein